MRLVGGVPASESPFKGRVLALDRVRASWELGSGIEQQGMGKSELESTSSGSDAAFEPRSQTGEMTSTLAMGLFDSSSRTCSIGSAVLSKVSSEITLAASVIRTSLVSLPSSDKMSSPISCSFSF